MPSLKQVPVAVRQAMGRQIKNATRIAAEHYDAGAANERSLTGALVAKLEEEVNGQWRDWSWSSRATTLSEAPAGVGEDALGADFVVQVDVYEGGINTAQKLVLVQGKVRWDDGLESQARKMSAFPGGGIVADYRPGAYLGVGADDVVRVGAKRSQLNEKRVRDLGAMLGDDFLECKIGTEDAYVSVDRSRIVFTGKELKHSPVPLRSDHLLRVSVKNPIKTSHIPE